MSWWNRNDGRRRNSSAARKESLASAASSRALSIQSSRSRFIELQESRKPSLRLDPCDEPPEDGLIPTPTVLQRFYHVTPWKLVSAEDEKELTYEKLVILRGIRRQQLRQIWTMYHPPIRPWAVVLKECLFGGAKRCEVSDETVLDVIRYHFPPRQDLIVHVLDFGPGKCETTRVKLANIEQYFAGKPAWADVRWIHAPLGLGLIHSSVEDLFLGARTGPITKFGPHHAWPYVDRWTETMNFRDKQDIQDMRDVYMILLQMNEKNPELAGTLDNAIEDGLSDSLKNDMEWRRAHLGLKNDYWTMHGADMPMQFSEGLALRHEPKDQITPSVREAEELALSKLPMFQGVQLVRNPFRVFHRPDGYILSLSSCAGVDFLNKDLKELARLPVAYLTDNPDSCVLGLLFKLFRNTGSSTWHRRTVEWLLVYIMTEVAMTPHNIRQGRSATSLMSAYQSVVQNLKHRKFKPFKRDDTVQLTREYLSCIDELSTINAIFRSKIAGLETLKDAVSAAEQSGTQPEPDNPSGETALGRLDWAISNLQESHQLGTRLLEETKCSMEAFFQLRTIEQNEINILSDNQNRAVLIFTIITMIFLPLSFFTSYYGMNLKGIEGTDRSERYFWKTGGSVTIVITLFVLMYLLRRKLRQKQFVIQRACNV